MWLLFNRDTWREIFDSINKNRVRTFLTVIGVVWGIFLYIVLSGAARGMDNGFNDAFKDVAMNSLFVWGEKTSVPYEGYKIGRAVRLQLSDVDKLKNKLADVQYIAPRKVRGLWGGTPPSLVKGQKSGQYIVYGDYPVVIKIAAKKIYQGGRFINDEDIRQARKVCVIGERTQKDLFAPDENPIGQYVKIDSSYFKVIGVHKYTEGGGMETDGDVYIPFTTYQKLYNSGQSVDWLAIAAFDDVDIVDLEAQVKTQLKQAHRVAPEDERAIVSFNLGVMFDKITGFSKGMNFLSIVVGVATILAGVVGIGNILLISVKERTQELGIRRALGATPGEIRGLILLESVFLTLSAGVTGIVLGAGVLALLALATEGIDFPYQNPTVPLSYVFGSLVIMTVLSTLIGLIPAQRAISIRPIDALRDE